MGLEEGELEGVLTDDLINVLEGYIIDDYEVNVRFSYTGKSDIIHRHRHAKANHLDYEINIL